MRVFVSGRLFDMLPSALPVFVPMVSETVGNVSEAEGTRVNVNDLD